MESLLRKHRFFKSDPWLDTELAKTRKRAEARLKKDLEEADAAVEQKAALAPASRSTSLCAGQVESKAGQDVKALKKQLQDSSKQ